MKAFLGKYKAKEVDRYISSLEAFNNEKVSALEAKIAQLQAENSALKTAIEEFKEKESVIAQVMLDATQRAKEIEEDYRKRADESDEACQRLHDEWVTGMQSAAANLNKMREAAKRLLGEIDSQFEGLCTWADMRLESLSGVSLPTTTDAVSSLETEIARGAGAELGELCKEMGINNENEAADEEE